LISVGDEGEFVGVDGISAHGNGGIYAIMALSNEATGFPSELGHLFKLSSGGQIRDIANVGGFDFEWTKAHIDLAPETSPTPIPTLSWRSPASSTSRTLARTH
jgi:hypothetical protein